MNKVVKDHIRFVMEVYMSDMIVKFTREEAHMSHLEVMFKKVCRYNMRISLEKRTFGIIKGKFRGYYFTKGDQDQP